MKYHLTMSFLLSFFLLSCQNKQNESPNILLILTDDQGWGDVGFHGNDTIETPNLDKLAMNAVKYLNSSCF